MSVTSLSRTLSPMDASFLWWERNTQRLHVGCVSLLDGPVAYDDLVRLVDQRLCSTPRWRERPVRAFLDWRLPTWETVPAFDPRLVVKHVAAPAPGGQAELQRVADAIFATPLDPELPLWEFTLVDGLENERSALICKIHHCMIDGVSGAQILDVLTDTDPNAGEAALPPLPPGVASSSGSLLDRLASQARAAYEIGASLAEIVGNPATPLPFNGVLSPARHMVWAGFALDDLLALRGAAECKVNDVVLAIITGALRRELQAREHPVANAVVRALVPVSIRGAGDRTSLGNLVSAMSPLLPVHVEHPIERLRAIQREIQHRKERGQPQALGLFLSMLGSLPTALDALVARLMPDGMLYNTVCTNVPGPRGPRSMLGRRLLDVHPFAPLFFQMGIEFAILSQGDRISITATVDPALVPDADRLAHSLHASFEELRAAFQPPVEEAVAPAAPDRQPAPADAPAVTRVAELMTRPVIAVGAQDSLATAWRLMRRSRVRHLPVMAPSGGVLGLLTQRDLLGASTSSVTMPDEEQRVGLLELVRVEDVMETHVQVTSADAHAADAGSRMLRGKIGCLPVVDGDGRLVGIVTADDFLRWATARLGEQAPAEGVQAA